MTSMSMTVKRARSRVRSMVRAIVLGATVAVAVAVSAWPAPARAQESESAPYPERWPAPQVRVRRERPDVWQLAVGVRTTIIRGAAFDRFSVDDAMAQLSSTVSRVVFSTGALAIGAGLAVDIGSSDAMARNATASLSLDRASLLLDVRYRPHRRVQAFARVAPGVVRGSATVTDDPNIGIGTLQQTFALGSIDGSAGAAVSLTPATSAVGFWLVAEGGYGWTPSQHLVLAPHLDEQDRDKAGTLDAGTLAPRGPFFRVALALSF
jgi:hypothetical protein